MSDQQQQIAENQKEVAEEEKQQITKAYAAYANAASKEVPRIYIQYHWSFKKHDDCHSHAKAPHDLESKTM